MLGDKRETHSKQRNMDLGLSLVLLFFLFVSYKPILAFIMTSVYKLIMGKAPSRTSVLFHPFRLNLTKLLFPLTSVVKITQTMPYVGN